MLLNQLLRGQPALFASKNHQALEAVVPVVAGFAVGQYDLGLMYAEGTGVAKNVKEATRLISLAASQEYALAILELARYARDGTGKTADKWTSKKFVQAP